MKSKLAVLVLAVVAGCDIGGPSYRIQIGLGQLSGDFPSSFRLGDTINVHASEWEQEFLQAEEPTSSSTTRPGDFTWESKDPNVVQVISPGRIVMKGQGVALLHVEGPRTSAAWRIVVFPTGSSIRILPRNPTVNVGVTLTFQVAAMNPQGVEFARLLYGEVSVAPKSAHRMPYEPILQQQPGSLIQMRAVKAGTDSVLATASIHLGPTLRDSITVVVR